jgi:hypothetical protein
MRVFKETKAIVRWYFELRVEGVPFYCDRSRIGVTDQNSLLSELSR